VNLPPIPSFTTQKAPPAYDTKRELLLNARNISFSYSRHTAINKVSLSIQRGETVALMGDNGSGKTTLLSLLGGLQPPHQGEILLQSKRIQSYPREELVQRIGLVFQNPNHQMFERTVWKEQTLTLQALDIGDAEHLATAEALLKEAHLEALVERNPFSLSHGQKRRLNITSILSHGPEILLLDEPFVGQDREGRTFVAEIISRHTSRGGAAVIVTHDMEYALASCNRILFLEDGTVLLDGPPLDVLKQLDTLNYSEYTEVLP
jgi:energy-coupling factor transport system ATP-binding protein